MEDALAKNEQLTKTVLADLQKLGKAKLAANEVLCAVAIISGTGSEAFPGDETSHWTPENGFLTASNKIDRNSIKHGKEMGGEMSGNFAGMLQPLRKIACGGGDPGDLP